MRNSTTIWAIAFAAAVLYAVVGNVVVYFALRRRSVTLRPLWAGTPGYLYRVCVDAGAVVGMGLTRFAFSTVIAFLLALLLVIPLATER